MSRRMPIGICNICGQTGELSYEHVPPRSAFNDCKVLLASVDSYWNHGPGRGRKARGMQLQAGYGANTLCERCNRTTGKWYVPFFSDWCRQGMEFYDKTGGKAALLYFSIIYPLPIIKQIVTMFLARNGGGIRADKKEPLVRFVLNREARYLDPKFRFWVYYVAPGPLRDTPPCAILNVKTGQAVNGMEFSFPPFGYMLTIGSRPEDRRPFEITHFARYGPFEQDRVTLCLEELPTHTPVLGDYRSFKKMDRNGNETNVILSMG